MTHSARPHLEFTQSFKVKSRQERLDADVIEDSLQCPEEIPIIALLPFPKNGGIGSWKKTADLI